MANRNKKERSTILTAENEKGIENHRQAAEHLEEAAQHYEEGNHEKAFERTVKAQGHHYLAGEHQREVVKQHAKNN